MLNRIKRLWITSSLQQKTCSILTVSGLLLVVSGNTTDGVLVLILAELNFLRDMFTYKG